MLPASIILIVNCCARQTNFVYVYGVHVTVRIYHPAVAIKTWLGGVGVALSPELAIDNGLNFPSVPLGHSSAKETVDL